MSPEEAKPRARKAAPVCLVSPFTEIISFSAGVLPCLSLCPTTCPKGVGCGHLEVWRLGLGRLLRELTVKGVCFEVEGPGRYLLKVVLVIKLFPLNTGPRF